MSRDPQNMILDVRDVSLVLGGKRRLKEINFTLPASGCTCVMGANGAGKSLLLRVCHGLITPTLGSVRWHIPPASGQSFLTPQAMVFQRPVLLRRSVRDNIAYVLELLPLSPAERETRLLEAIAQAGLERLVNAPARVLSGGEQQRVALARAWAMQPRVLLMDEPTSNLDPASTHWVEIMVQKFRALGTKVIMTTHDRMQAQRLADDVLFLHGGWLKEQTSAEIFFKTPAALEARAYLKGELIW